MNRINFYLFFQTSRYIIFNLLIISVLIIFINLIELSRLFENGENSLLNLIYLSLLRLPSVLNDILPFVVIIACSFLLRNLINNNELISMRNVGFSIFNVFYPIGISVFIFGLLFLLFINPISTIFENKLKKITNKNDQSLYSIKIINNEMWINNLVDSEFSSFINIENINIQNMNSINIKILLTEDNKNKLIQAESGLIIDDKFILKNVKLYEIDQENYITLDEYILDINFNKENIKNSIINFKLIPFYKYFTHTKTLTKFNLYSPEIGLFYLSEILKPVFIVMLSFVILGFSSRFKRNENFFKVLFISILIGFLIFLFKEMITKITIMISINFFLSYFLIFTIPFLIGLYQVIKIENE